MKTTATNRKVRVLLSAIKNETLVPKPEFQRRLVWSNKHKRAFIDTVLKGYPFPEIYIAAGEVDPDTAEGIEMLVDGQQRITTLYQYFTGSPELSLDGELEAYSDLDPSEKKEFLEYEVVVRDLGKLSIDEIREVFERINSTRYALNAMEIHNARYEGEFKRFGEDLSQSPFFEDHHVFTASDIRRMHDVRFCLVYVITLLSTYFDGDSELEDYLSRYNDEFPKKSALKRNIDKIFSFIDDIGFDDGSRVWKKPDLLTLLVELYRLMFEEKMKLSASKVLKALRPFYDRIDNLSSKEKDPNVLAYYKASSQGTNHRGNRIMRGKIVANLLSQ